MDFRSSSLWVATVAALFPAISWIAMDGGGAPYGYLALLWPLLMIRCEFAWSREPVSAPRPLEIRMGASCLMAALFTALVGLRADIALAARLSFPMALVGLAFATGIPRPSTAMLSPWMVVPPTSAYLSTTPAMESALARLVADLLGRLGIDVLAAGPLIVHGSSTLYLQPQHNGLHLAWLGTGMGLYFGLRRDPSARRAQLLPWMALGLVAGAAIQPVVLVSSAILLRLGATDVAQQWLDVGGILCLAGITLPAAEWVSARRRVPGSGELAGVVASSDRSAF